MDSLELLLDTARAERSAQLTHFDALDAEAGLILGFASTGIALAPAVPTVARLPTLALLVVSAGCALRAFQPRQLPTLDVNELRAYLRAEDEFTRLRLHDTIVVMVGDASRELKLKARAVRRAMLCLASAAPFLAVGIAIGGAHG